jgi:hypothetical protein
LWNNCLDHCHQRVKEVPLVFHRPICLISSSDFPLKMNVKICPVHTLLNYLKLRPKLEGPLFCHFNHKSVTRFQVSSMLKSTLRFLFNIIFRFPSQNERGCCLYTK